jgi:hypothetical protein
MGRLMSGRLTSVQIAPDWQVYSVWVRLKNEIISNNPSPEILIEDFGISPNLTWEIGR